MGVIGPDEGRLDLMVFKVSEAHQGIASVGPIVLTSRDVFVGRADVSHAAVDLIGLNGVDAVGIDKIRSRGERRVRDQEVLTAQLIGTETDI